MWNCKHCGDKQEQPWQYCRSCGKFNPYRPIEATGSPAPSGQDNILKVVQAGLELASIKAAEEVAHGDIVRENYWRGKMTAFKLVKSTIEKGVK